MTLTAVEHPAITTSDPRTLIEPALFERLAGRIATECGAGLADAERILGQALAFLMACAHNRGQSLSPSARVDIGWHAFILHTREYAAFCDRVAGRFIHHEPEDTPAGVPEAQQAVRDRTLTAIRRSGFAIDTAMWQDSTECSNGGGPGGPGGGCHQGCHDSA